MAKRIKLELRQLDIPSKIKKAEAIVTCLKDNDCFPSPDPSLSEITAAYTELQKIL